jgi:hypothetical protein
VALLAVPFTTPLQACDWHAAVHSSTPDRLPHDAQARVLAARAVSHVLPAPRRDTRTLAGAAAHLQAAGFPGTTRLAPPDGRGRQSAWCDRARVHRERTLVLRI